MKRIFSAILAALTMVTMFSGCSQTSEEPERSEIFVMSTYVSQQVYGEQKAEAVKKVNELLVSLEKELSLYIEGSDIDRINKNAGIAPVEVSDYTYELVKKAKEYSELSEGRFDITIAPVTLLWAIDSDHPTVPEQAQLDEALKLVDYRKIQLDDEKKSVYLETKGMALDLGGVAKGYIAGRIWEEYQKYAIKTALVSIGGNICAYGLKPDGKPFKLGIRDPLSTVSTDIIGKLTVTDRIVATTGAYERYFEKDGKRYHHVLDPKTGYPVDSDLLSVTVICPDGGLADYLSTTLFIGGKALVSEYMNDSRFDLIVIDKDKKVTVSKEIQDQFELTAEGYELENLS